MKVSRHSAIIILFVIISSAWNANTHAQLFNGFSVDAGYGIFRSGWVTPDDYIARMYKEPFYTRDWKLGTSLEFFRNKFQSVIISAGYKFRLLEFDFDQKNSTGQVTGTSTTGFTLSTFQFTLAERLRYHFRHTYLFVYAGPRVDLNFSTSGRDADFNSFLNTIKPNSIGLTAGAGIGLEFGRHFNLTAEVYYEPDFTKTFSSANGYLKSSEIGVRLGFWRVNKSGNK